MLALKPPSTAPRPKSCIPNILPCRINHNGPVNASSKRYWNPSRSISTSSSTENTSLPTTAAAEAISTAYFRGRKLLGREVKIPEGYRGVVIVDTKVKNVVQAGGHGKGLDGHEKNVNVDMDMNGEDGTEEEGILEEVAQFDEFVVWGHECIGGEEGVGEEYVKGVQEWVGWAGVIHEYSNEERDAEA